MAKPERKTSQVPETILIIVLVTLFAAGTIAFILWTTRGAQRRLLAEVHLLRMQLTHTGQLTGLPLHFIKVVDGQGGSLQWPPLPMLYGVQRGYRISVSPDYLREFSSDTDEPMVQERAIIVRVVAGDPEDRFAISPDMQPQSREDLLRFWESQRPRQGSDLKESAAAETLGVLARLIDPHRRPLRVVRLSRFAIYLEAEIEYVNPSRVKIETVSIRDATDPVDLARIVQDLVAIADALPLRPR